MGMLFGRPSAAPINLRDLYFNAPAPATIKSRRPSIGERAADALSKAGVSQRTANRWGEKLASTVEALTPVGNITGGFQAGQDFRRGNYLAGGLGAVLSMIPGAPETKMARGLGRGIRAYSESGKPVRFYHGTASAFDDFDAAKIGKGTDAGKLGRGIYFSARPDIASFYANYARPTGGEIAPNVIPAHLQLDNPVTFDAGDGKDLFAKLRLLSNEWGISHNPVIDEANTPNPEWAEAFTSAARQRGHDGALLRFPDGGHEAVVFSPEQIASIFGR